MILAHTNNWHACLMAVFFLCMLLGMWLDEKYHNPVLLPLVWFGGSTLILTAIAVGASYAS